jgi:hypothetical protein
LNILTLSVSTLSGSEFVLGRDFSLDPTNGIVTRITSGGISSGASVNIAWSYADAAVAIEGESSPVV